MWTYVQRVGVDFLLLEGVTIVGFVGASFVIGVRSFCHFHMQVSASFSGCNQYK